MSSMQNIGVWCATGTLIAATGKFLDDFHFRSKTKERMRAALIHAFVYIEEAGSPGDASLLSSDEIRSAYREITSWSVLLWAVVGWLGSLVLQMAVWFFWPSMTDYDPSRLGIAAVLVFSICLFITSSRICATLLDGYRKASSIARKFIFAFAFVVPGSLVVVTLPVIFLILVIISLTGSPRFFLFLLTSVVYGIVVTFRRVFVHILDAASDPKTSPFLYTSSLMGLLVAVLGVLKEVLFHPH